MTLWWMASGIPVQCCLVPQFFLQQQCSCFWQVQHEAKSLGCPATQGWEVHLPWLNDMHALLLFDYLAKYEHFRIGMACSRMSWFFKHFWHISQPSGTVSGPEVSVLMVKTGFFIVPCTGHCCYRCFLLYFQIWHSSPDRQNVLSHFGLVMCWPLPMFMKLNTSRRGWSSSTASSMTGVKKQWDSACSLLINGARKHSIT